jgi:MFS family permease
MQTYLVSHRAAFQYVRNSACRFVTDEPFQLGAFFGSIMAFTLGDKLGRKWTITIGLIANTVGAVLQVSAFQFPQLIVGRVVNGFGMGKKAYPANPCCSG